MKTPVELSELLDALEPGDGPSLLPSLVGERRAVLVYDRALAPEMVDGLSVPDRIPLPAGEATKTLEMAGELYRQLSRLGLNRDGLLVAAGGGTITDLAGFVGATYLRGIAFGFVPTTLLAQVDAAIGGKNGVNLEGVKNQVGTIVQPEFVVLDPAWIATLPADQMLEGMAEVIKIGAVAAPEVFELLEENLKKALAGDPDLIGRLIEKSARAKLEIVARDEREGGARKLLNFGHTLAHGLEATGGLSHGLAVAVGMRWAVQYSRDQGLLSVSDASRLENLIEDAGLPTRFEADPETVIAAMARDKKRRSDAIDLVLLRAIGDGVVKPTPLADIESVVRRELSGGAP